MSIPQAERGRVMHESSQCRRGFEQPIDPVLDVLSVALRRVFRLPEPYDSQHTRRSSPELKLAEVPRDTYRWSMVRFIRSKPVFVHCY